jgi:uncharacterized protein (DUF2267 family)
MSAVGLESLDHSVQLAREWIGELDDALGWNNRHRSYRLLRAVLQVLRDCLPLAEAAHLSAQLPLVLRGVFFEHWRPEQARHWDIDRFFAAIDASFPQDPLDDADRSVSAVFGLIRDHVSVGEVDHVKSCLPREIRELWRVH